MSKSNSAQKDEHVVYLAYIEDGDRIDSELKDPIQPSSSKDQSSSDAPIQPWLVNKVGGLPIFPYDESLVVELDNILDSLKCKHCKSACVLIFQINSPIDESPRDRVIQVYTCVKIDCIKHSWFALRCMFRSEHKKSEPNVPSSSFSELKHLELIEDPTSGTILCCRERSFFDPYYLTVVEEPTGKENFAKNNLEALKLASKFSDPDLKPAPIEEKYKNLKNYKPPKPQANLSDLDDFEKFQMEKLYGNDKDMYKFYKRLARYQAQVCRYDWEGEPLINSNRIKLDIQTCPSCSSKRKFEFQLMSALINYLKTDKEFDSESQDFSSILIHSCAKNCSIKTYNIEDTYFMPDPDSRIFNKVKQKMLALKLGESMKGDKPMSMNPKQPGETECELNEQQPIISFEYSNINSTSGQSKKKKNKKKKKTKN